MRRTLMSCRLPSTRLAVGLETLAVTFGMSDYRVDNSMLASLNNWPAGLGW